SRGLGMQRSLLLRRRKRPRSTRAALLSEDEAQLLRRTQLRLGGAERGARLIEIEGAEQVATEEALVTADFWRWALALRSRCHALPPGIVETRRTAGIKAARRSDRTRP